MDVLAVRNESESDKESENAVCQCNFCDILKERRFHAAYAAERPNEIIVEDKIDAREIGNAD